MRITKIAEDRRNEILDAADELFGCKGFDGTSTNDILDKVHIARGTLYYHFKSKEDIMDALIERSNDRLVGVAQAIAADKSMALQERLVRVVMAMNISNGSGKEIKEHMHKPQNALMHQKINRILLSGLTPILAGLIREGVELGLYNTPFPYECMEMIMTYANTVFDDDMPELNDEDRISRIRAFIFNTERLLGAEKDSLLYITRVFASKGKD